MATAPVFTKSTASDARPGVFRRSIGKYLGVLTEQQSAAHVAYDDILAQVVAGVADLSVVPEQLAAVSREADFPSGKERQLRIQAARALVDRILADEVLSEADDDQIGLAFDALGIGQADLQGEMRATGVRVMIARVNAGRLDPQDNHHLICKPGERVFLEVPARILKEVTIRQYQAGYSGVSFRVAKGVRFHTGGMRGRMVPVGTELQTVDSGILSISSERSVYLGSKKTQEFKYSKLVGLQLFADAVTIQVSNRQNATILAVRDPDLVAAYVNAAAQEAL